MAGDHKTASIISISWIAFWRATTRRPASSASAGSRFGCGPPDGQHHQHHLDRFLAGRRPDGQHHQHQLDRVLAGDRHPASIISISWIAFWLATTRRPASSASAGSLFGWGPPDGQHHQHQLGRGLAGDHQTAASSASAGSPLLALASIISISWIAFWLGTTRRPASSASAGSRLGWGPPDGQHHQHQLGRVWAGNHQTASIISIGWVAFWLTTTRRPASSASAGSRCGWRPLDGQHHQPQLGPVLAGGRPASSASAGSRFGWGPPDGQHHQHQLGLRCWLGTTRQPASSASAGSRFGWGPPDGQHHQHQLGRVLGPPPGQHHQHQLDRVLAGDHQTASIISISWIAFWLGTASIISISCKHYQHHQNHQHQLDRVLAGDHQTASIISISWIAFWLGDHQTASIISISWIAFWPGTTMRPASSASAGSRFGWGPPDGQHHQHQLDRDWLGTTRRPASSASAGSRFGWGPQDGQHHQHQLGRVLAGDHHPASIISISWIAFWHHQTASIINNNWIAFGWGPPDGQHHQHQLDRVLAGDHQTASIISISWVAFWLGTTRRPASSASAGSHFGRGPPCGQHHQHQLDRVLAGDHQTASIISISWIKVWLGTTRRPASSASAGSHFGWGPPDGQHHQHQLGRVLAGDHHPASNISISWVAFWLGTTRRPASSASAGSRFGWGPPDGQHHQHQLDRVLAGDHQTASIISISWIAFWLGTTTRPASSASAGSRFGWGPPDGQHHQHHLDRFLAGRRPDGQHHQQKLGRVLAGDHQTASIISISWVAFWLGTTRRPASSASAGSLFGRGPPGGQHHQHQLDRVLAGDHKTASIISISWIKVWLGTTRRPASSASAGSRFGWGPPDGQHHQHQLGRVLAGDQHPASIISISWVAFWLGTTRRPASSASAGSRFGR